MDQDTRRDHPQPPAVYVDTGGKFGLPTRESKAIFTCRKTISFPVPAYPVIAAVLSAAAGMGAAFAFSTGFLAYVYAMNHWYTAKGWSRKFFCDMKSKRSPEMVGLFEKHRRFSRRSPPGSSLVPNRYRRHPRLKKVHPVFTPPDGAELDFAGTAYIASERQIVAIYRYPPLANRTNIEHIPQTTLSF